ncbi:hypothetical protein [Brasilonema bromeliae]|uniref:Uncharacterized protein n=1 Tax=Brasilonema bromeliae SPC951 TaxID=385972 RepID=A0ABX1PFH3_9CYAN|nr:hypothetical protein [Brasilonema bromeliae]NMG23044.1 hypothetical protein [Brasilonema bromeliae SPC951]
MLRIAEEWKPESPEEESQRAYFFLHMVGAQCMEHLEHVLEESPRPLGVISTEKVLHAVKFICCVSSHLAVLEQADGAPQIWMKEWLLHVHKQIEEMIPEHSMFELNSFFANLDIDEICRYATEQICLILTVRRHEFQDILWDMIEEDKEFRNEILVTSFKESTDALREHAALFP